MADAPRLPAHLTHLWVAFMELSTCRSYIGMTGAPGPIPWTAIQDYARKHGFAGESFDDLVQIVRAVDDRFLANSAKKRDDKGEPQPVQPEDGAPGHEGG